MHANNYHRTLTTFGSKYIDITIVSVSFDAYNLMMNTGLHRPALILVARLLSVHYIVAFFLSCELQNCFYYVRWLLLVMAYTKLVEIGRKQSLKLCSHFV